METEVFNNTRGSRFFSRAPGGVLIEINTREDVQHARWQKLFSKRRNKRSGAAIATRLAADGFRTIVGCVANLTATFDGIDGVQDGPAR